MLRDHGVDDRLGAVENALEINFDHAVELFLAHVLDMRIGEDARVVDKAIDAAPLRHRRRHHAFERLDVAHVGNVSHGIAADFLAHLDGCLDRFRSQVADHDLGAFGGKLEGGRLPDAAARPGDDRYLVLKPHRSPFLEIEPSSLVIAVRNASDSSALHNTSAITSRATELLSIN